MFDIKVIQSILSELEEERGIPKQKVIEAIEAALATAYKKEYAKKGQIIRAHINLDTGTTEFSQVKVVVDKSTVRFVKEGDEEQIQKPPQEMTDEELLSRFNPEQHILLEDAKLINRDAGDYPKNPRGGKGFRRGRVWQALWRNCIRHGTAHGARQHLCRPRPRHRDTPVRRADTRRAIPPGRAPARTALPGRGVPARDIPAPFPRQPAIFGQAV